MAIRISPSIRTTTSQTPGRKINNASVSGQITEMLGNASQQIFEQIKVTNAIAEKTRAQNQRDSALLDIQSRAEQDSDITALNQQKYDKEIRKTISESSKLISIPQERSFFELESEQKSMVAQATIKKGFTTKIIAQGKADLDTYVGNKGNEYVNATNDLERSTAILERNNKFREAVNAGYITKEDAAAHIEKIDKDWLDRKLDKDISDDPDFVIENIKDYGLTAKEENTALELATSLKKKRARENKLQSEEALIDNEIALYEGIQNGTKSLGDINDAVARGKIGYPGGIRSTSEQAFKDLIVSDKEPTPEEKAKTFVDLQDRFAAIQFEEPTAEDILKFKADVVSAMSNKSITQATGQGWIKDLSENDYVREKSTAWGMISDWAFYYATGAYLIKAVMGEKLNERVEKGEDPVDAANKVINEEKKAQNPQWNNLEVGDPVTTPDGRTWKVIGFLPNGEPDVELMK